MSANELLNVAAWELVHASEDQASLEAAAKFSDEYREFLEDALYAVRVGDPELVKSLRQLVKSMVLIGKKREREEARERARLKAG